MRIGYVVQAYPPLTETFIRREILALCDLGHQVFVYMNTPDRDRNVVQPSHENLRVRRVAWCHSANDLASAAKSDGIEHLHATLTLRAHRATHAAAEAAQTPFSITAYSGHSVFTATDPELYRALSRSPYCGGVVVEDAFMAEWVTRRLSADPERIVVIPNSLDMDAYRPSGVRRDRVIILAIGRFVEKKGFHHLVEAFRRMKTPRSDVELHLIGFGPLERLLRATAGSDRRIRFLGALPEAECRRAYDTASICAMPCVIASDRDADGIPTVVLEAMACGLPVVASDLLSLPQYVRHRQEGLLSPPGDTNAIAAALAELCQSAALREELGTNGRRRAEELCDIDRNIQRFDDMLRTAKRRRWQFCMDALNDRRRAYSEDVLRSYAEKRRRAVSYLQPRGRLLEVGCGGGAIRETLPPQVAYFGCDVAPVRADFPVAVAAGESLPFRSASFDAVLFYSVIAYAFDLDRFLDEACRVLRPGGQLLLRECVNDDNPIHPNHISDHDLRGRIERRLELVRWQMEDSKTMLLAARKPDRLDKPLVSIAIAAYNRAPFLKDCIESLLRQTYQPLEICVVDDGSTDGTREVLRRYEGRVRVHRHEHNLGIAAAKNRGLRMTSAEARYVALLDSDDFLHPAFVEKCVRYLEAHANIGFVYTDEILVDSRGVPTRRRSGIEPWSVEEFLRTRNLRGDSWLARRDLVMRTRLHEERLSRDVDYDLYYQLLEITEFAHLAEHLIYHRTHPGQASNDYYEVTKCHAANLVRYGYSPEYAYLRARQHPEWVPAIEEGIELGKRLLEERRRQGAA